MLELQPLPARPCVDAARTAEPRAGEAWVPDAGAEKLSQARPCLPQNPYMAVGRATFPATVSRHLLLGTCPQGEAMVERELLTLQDSGCGRRPRPPAQPGSTVRDPSTLPAAPVLCSLQRQALHSESPLPVPSSRSPTARPALLCLGRHAAWRAPCAPGGLPASGSEQRCWPYRGCPPLQWVLSVISLLTPGPAPPPGLISGCPSPSVSFLGLEPPSGGADHLQLPAAGL